MARKQANEKNEINSMLSERRVFKAKAEFVKQANMKSKSEYERLYKQSIKQPEKFWATQANKEIFWFKKWKKVLDWKLPNAKWFVGGETNVSYNCVDRHALGSRKNKAAIIWEGEPGDSRVLTYQDLHREVSKFSNVLLKLGVKSGDRVVIYMPLVPEAAIAMLSCARIGAVHTVVFGGFASHALRDRIQDSGASLVITADGGFRRGQAVNLKTNVDAALEETTTVRNVVVLRRSQSSVEMKPGRDVWWHEIIETVSKDSAPAKLASEHPLYILYTSGTTGKPKGLLHTTAGYLLGVTLTTKYVFDMKETDTFWCTADVGWVTGHSYLVYGPLSVGATIVMYEGAPNWPQWDRFWAIVEKYRVSILYTAPTAIRSFIRAGDEWPNKHDLSSLRLLGSVGEPINPEAWMWYYRVIGGSRCPVVDTWWQTETGSIMMSPIPAAIPQKPGSCTLPFFGVEPIVVDKSGKEVARDQGGLLAIKKPWPAMARTIFNDSERYRKAYWSDVPNCYFTGDGARRDKDGYFWIMGRVDDVLNVSGHRLGTMEVESVLVQHNRVAEAAVVGRPDEIKGQAVVAFVTLKNSAQPSPELMEELRNHVAKEIGAIARPEEIRFTEALPKTRSGKIMRRLLREVASTGTVSGDTTTLEDFSVVEKLRSSDEE